VGLSEHALMVNKNIVVIVSQASKKLLWMERKFVATLMIAMVSHVGQEAHATILLVHLNASAPQVMNTNFWMM
jgi:SpoU rRNA methylase family enzyme